MKRLSLMAVLLISSSCLLQAQWVPGIKGGLNIADVTSFNGSNRVGVHAGFLLHKTLNSRWCVQPELLYAGMGQKYETASGEHTLALDYLQVPVMIQYYATPQLYFEFGPQLSFLLSAAAKGDNGSKLEVDNQYNKADLGLNFGVGVAATPRFGFYGRYLAGLTDITRNDDVNHANRGAQIGLFYRLH